MITKKELTKMLAGLETDRIEKTISTKDATKFGEAICSFCNDLPNKRLPGYLLIGIQDDGQLAGMTIKKPFFRTEIELIRGNDIALVEEGFLEPEKIRSIKVEALVDSGAYMLVINEEIKSQLALKHKGKELATLADGSQKELEVVGPIEVRFKTRRTTVDALVVPGNAEVLLGAIPLEGMDVLIDPNKQELVLPPTRPYIAGTILKGVRKR